MQVNGSKLKLIAPPPEWTREAFDKVEGQKMTKLGDDSTIVQPMIDRLRAEQFTIRSVKPVRESLEDYSCERPFWGGAINFNFDPFTCICERVDCPLHGYFSFNHNCNSIAYHFKFA